LWLAALLGAALALGACGSDDSNDPGAATAAGGDGAAGKVVGDRSSTDLEHLPTDTDQLCGDQPIKIAQVDGFGNNSWRKTAEAELRDELSVCPNVEVTYAQAGGDVQRYNAQVNAFVAQGYDAIVTHDDFAEQGLPALRRAFEAGVVVVPYTASPGGEPGVDYTAFVDYDRRAVARRWAEWLDRVLDGRGDVIFIGGVPGNKQSLGFLEAAKAAMPPGISFLQDTPVDTNWDPAQYQRVTAGLMSKYPRIDAILSDYGQPAVGQMRAYINAGKEHPPLATLASANELGCMYLEHTRAWPHFRMVWFEGTTRMPRWAGRRALAAVNRIELADPTLFELFPFVDTENGRDPVCRRDLPPDADLSTGLTPDELSELFG
jgi:ribose transport system substrate-binding protein